MPTSAIAVTSTQYLAVESTTIADSNQNTINFWGNLFSPLSPGDSILVYDSSIGEVCGSTISGSHSGPIGVDSEVDSSITVDSSCSQ